MQLALVPAPEQDGNAADPDAEGDEEAEPGAVLRSASLCCYFAHQLRKHHGTPKTLSQT